MTGIGRSAFLAALAILAGAPFALLPLVTPTDGTPAAAQSGSAAPASRQWAATAPGKVEPRGGEFRISAATAGRIVETLAVAGDLVEAGDLLVRIDDAEFAARAGAALAEAAQQKLTRDEQAAPARVKRRYDADDALWNADLRNWSARGALDQAMVARRAGKGSDVDVERARSEFKAATDQLVQTRAAAAAVRAEANPPPLVDLETALVVSRSQATLTQVLLEQARVRAPVAGTVLQVTARVGESAGSGGDPLMVIGDLTQLRVRAEIDERDFAKVRLGQRAVIRADAFRDTEFAGKVTTIAPALAPSKLTVRGLRRAADIDALEILLTLDGAPPLRSGLRVDVYLYDEGGSADGRKP